MTSAGNSYEEKYANESFENETDNDIPEISDESESERELKSVDSKTLYAYARRDFEKHRNSQKLHNYNQYETSSDDEDDVVISETIAEINTEPMSFDELMDTPRFGARRKNSLEKVATEKLQDITKIMELRQTNAIIEQQQQQERNQQQQQQQQQQSPQPYQNQQRQRTEELAFCVTEIVEEEEEEENDENDDNEAYSATDSEYENKEEQTLDTKSRCERTSDSEVEAEDDEEAEESIAEIEYDEVAEAETKNGHNDDERSSEHSASEEEEASEEELNKNDEETEQEDGAEAESQEEEEEDEEQSVTPNEQRDHRKLRDPRSAEKKVTSIDMRSGHESGRMIDHAIVRHIMPPRGIAQKINKQMVQQYQREQFVPPEGSTYGETETENEYEPRVEMHISSETPTSFNSDDYAFHLNFVRKTPSNEKLRTRTAPNRKSFSFSNDRMREIERQNHILLKKILTQKPTIAPNRVRGRIQDKFAALPPTTRVSSAAVNRKKQQRQIDLDNLGLKRRIEAISLRRNKQL